MLRRYCSFIHISSLVVSRLPRLPRQFVVRLLHKLVHSVGNMHLSCCSAPTPANCIVCCLEKKSAYFQQSTSSYIIYAKYDKLHNAKKAGADPELHSATNSCNNNIPCIVRTVQRLQLEEKTKKQNYLQVAIAKRLKTMCCSKKIYSAFGTSARAPHVLPGKCSRCWR